MLIFACHKEFLIIMIISIDQEKFFKSITYKWSSHCLTIHLQGTVSSWTYTINAQSNYVDFYILIMHIRNFLGSTHRLCCEELFVCYIVNHPCVPWARPKNVSNTELEMLLTITTSHRYRLLYVMSTSL